jgi:type VI protein secretion system component VasK
MALNFVLSLLVWCAACVLGGWGLWTCGAGSVGWGCAWALLRRRRAAQLVRDGQILAQALEHSQGAGAAPQRLRGAQNAGLRAPESSPAPSNPLAWLGPQELVQRPLCLWLGAAGSGTSALLQHSACTWLAQDLAVAGQSRLWIAQECLMLTLKEAHAAGPAGKSAALTPQVTALLQALRRTRPCHPIHAVAVLLSVADLQRLDTAALQAQARSLRRTLDSSLHLLQCLPQLVVVLTQADRLQGFAATFAAAAEAAHSGVWGGPVGATPLAVFDALVTGCAVGLLRGLTQTEPADLRQQVQLFPQTLAQLRAPLQAWTDEFFHGGARPREQGFAGTQGTHPAPTRRPQAHFSGLYLCGGAQTAQPLFVQRLVADVLLPLTKAAPPRPASRAARLGHLGAAALVAALCALCAAHVGGHLWRLQRSRAALQHSASLPPHAPLEALQRLQPLADALQAAAQAAAQQTALDRLSGLDPSPLLYRTLRQNYLQRLRDSVIAPLVADDPPRLLQASLQALSREGAAAFDQPLPYMACFNLLRLHLLLSRGAAAHTVTHSDTQWLHTVLLQRLLGQAAAPLTAAQQGALAAQLQTFLAAARGDRRWVLPANTSIIAAARQALNQVTAQRQAVMGLLQDDAAVALPLAQLVPQAQSVLLSPVQVPLGLTRYGFYLLMQARLQGPESALLDSWVLGAQRDGHLAVLLSGMQGHWQPLQTYLALYVEAWQALTASLELLRRPDPGGARHTLQALLTGEPPTPYEALVARLRENLGVLTEMQVLEGAALPADLSAKVTAVIRLQPLQAQIDALRRELAGR